MPTLSVLCHRCGQAFPSPLSLNEPGPSGPLLEGIVYECPHCGTRDPYFTAEHSVSVSGGYTAEQNPSSGWLRSLHSRLEGLRRFVPAAAILLVALVLIHAFHVDAMPVAH
jgi:hypothetical protein